MIRVSWIGSAKWLKSILDKNMQIVGKHSLIARAVRAGTNADIEHTYITTNSREYGAEAKLHGGKFDFLRPDKLSLDNSTDNDYLQHFAEWCKSKYMKFEFL